MDLNECKAIDPLNQPKNPDSLPLTASQGYVLSTIPCGELSDSDDDSDDDFTEK